MLSGARYARQLSTPRADALSCAMRLNDSDRLDATDSG
jgi:hypothetical protein